MNSKAVRALRKKFIFIAMLSIGVVIFCLVTLLNVANYVSTRREIRLVLETLCEQFTNPTNLSSSGSGYSGIESYSDSDVPSELFREGGNGLFSFFDFSDNTASQDYYERVNRGYSFFAVLLNTDGSVGDVFPEDIDEKTAIEAMTHAKRIVADRQEFGNYGVYYYLREDIENGSVVAFFDSSTQINAMQRLLYASVVICLGILIIVFWPVYFLSDLMIQPELRNIERQKQFITNASHELKTPLAVIRANTELIELMNGENEWTTSTLRQVDRMNGLIKNLVTIARAEEKADKSAMAEIDVSAAVKDTADTFAPVATQDGKELVQEIEENVRLVADEAKVRQLASLLLDNAIKYCDDGGKVVAQLSKKGKVVRLVVSNSYAAGESVDYSRFFERFYREDSSHNTEKGGYGIGLSIAESIVSSYNGSISASWKNGMISFTCSLL